MIILGIRTDKPEAELHLAYGNNEQAVLVWPAHRELARIIHAQIRDFLAEHNMQVTDIEGIVVLRGPGSFTGLRIGITVANTLARGLGVPIVGTLSGDWFKTGTEKLTGGMNDEQVLPEYGAPVHITPQKK